MISDQHVIVSQVPAAVSTARARGERTLDINILEEACCRNENKYAYQNILPFYM